MEIYIAHPDEGLLILDESKQTRYTSDLKPFIQDAGNLGRITHMAFNYNKNILCMYSDTARTLFILKSDLTRLFKKFETLDPPT